MIQRISAFFKAPVFEDEAKTRTAWVLNILAWGIIGVNLISMAAMVVFNASAIIEISVYSLLILIAGVTLLIMQKGYVRQAGYLFSVALLATTITASLFFGGVSGPNAGSFIAVPLIGSLLPGILAGLIFSLLSIASIIALVLVDYFGLIALHSTIHNNPVSFTIGLISVVIFMILIQYLFTNGLNQSLEHARQNERLHKELNEKLKTVRKELETQAKFAKTLDKIESMFYNRLSFKSFCIDSGGVELFRIVSIHKNNSLAIPLSFCGCGTHRATSPGYFERSDIVPEG